LRRVKEVSQRQ